MEVLELATEGPHASPPGLERARGRNAGRSGARSSPPAGQAPDSVESGGLEAMREVDPELWGLLVWVFLPLPSPFSPSCWNVLWFQQLILCFVLFLRCLFFSCGTFSSVVSWGLISILRVR